MEEISLIQNTGIQFYQLEEELTVDFNANIIKALRFYEFQIKDKIYLDSVYYFPMKDNIFVERIWLVLAILIL